MFNPESILMKKTGAIEGSLGENSNSLYLFYQKNEKLRKEREKRMKFLDMDDFLDVYPEEKIRKDKKIVREQRQREKEVDMAQKGELLEFVIGKLSDQAEWFGEMVAFRTLEFDDRKNGVDVVLEGCAEDGKPIYIAIDCTVSQKQETIDRKVDKIIQGIEGDTLSQIDYFYSDDGETKGRISQVPKVILAVSPERIEDLCGDCLSATERKYEKMNHSHFQIFFLRQLEAQLEKQSQLVHLPKKDLRPHKKEAIEPIDNALKYVRKILAKKKASLNVETVQRGEDELSFSMLAEL